MAITESRTGHTLQQVAKAPSGIDGLDEITGGGLPKGRPTLVCGSAGSGKTLFATEFLVHGAVDYDEPGVLMSFEETDLDMVKNVASLGFNLDDLIEQGKISVDYVRIERSEIEETGEYDLEGLFVRLGYAIDSIGAKRVVLDTLEALFGSLQNEAILRSELSRLFLWLKQKGVTALITAERSRNGELTRHGLEEYVSDCVILLDHRVAEQVSTRRIRVIKYRGSSHGTNEYPFLISDTGISIMPITSAGLDHEVSDERVSTGVARLDEMLEGKGYYRGSSILISGTAGTGKSSLAAHFAEATCMRGERCLYFAFEESPRQIIRNMQSIGINLEPWVAKGLLRFHSMRSSFSGLESHLALIHKLVNDFQPAVVIVDPVTNLINVGDERSVHAMLVRLLDFLKVGQITTFITSLTAGGSAAERTDIGISSLIDTWLLLRDLETAGERNRGLYVIKSRGMAHSNQIREFVVTSEGINLKDAYLGTSGVLTGSARLAQEAKEKAEQLAYQQEMERKRLELERKRKALEAQMSAIQAEMQSTELEAAYMARETELQMERKAAEREAMAISRKVSAPGTIRSTNGQAKEESDD